MSLFPVPSLFSLSLRATQSSMETQLQSFYKTHPPCSSITKESFPAPNALFELVSRFFYPTPRNPLDQYIEKLPGSLLNELATPHLLAKYVQLWGSSRSVEACWQTLCEKQGFHLETAVGDGKLTQSFEQTPLPIGGAFTVRECAPPIEKSSCSKPCITLPSRAAISRFKGTCVSKEQIFYMHYFEKNFNHARGHFSRLPILVQALYVENRKAIHSLHFSNNGCINGRKLISLGKLFPHLSYLHIQSCPHLTKESIKNIITNHPHLEQMHFIAAIIVDDETLSLMAKTCKKLKTLDFKTINSDVRKETLLKLIGNNPDLEKIELGRFKCLDDAAYAQIVLCCKRLRLLKVFDCDKITPRFFKQVFTQSSHLQELHIVRCNQFKDEYVEDAVEQYSLTQLEIKECHSLSPLAKSCLFKKFPNLC